MKRRIGGLLQHLDGAQLPDPQDFLATLEMLSMLETYFTPEQQDTLAQRRTQLGTDAIEVLRAEWLELVEQLHEHQQDGTPVDDPRVQDLTRRWAEIGTAFHDGDAQIVEAANRLWRDHRAELTRQLGWPIPGDGPDIVDYVHQAWQARQRIGQPRTVDLARRSEPAEIVSGAGVTALAAAAGRAVESSRPDRLINDPLAEAFVQAAGPPVAMPVRWPQDGVAVGDREALLLHGSSYLGVRSRFFDDYLRHACSTGIRQVVLLGAGLDARAFRFDWPAGLRLFEIDQAPVLQFKDTVLGQISAQARCDRMVLAVDLSEDWRTALLDGGFDPASATAWLAEGLLPYLPADAQQRLLDSVHDLSTPGSHLALERPVNLAGLAGADGARRLDEISERTGIDLHQLIYTDTRADPLTWLSEHGWTVTDQPVTTAAQYYHRTLPDPRLPLPTPDRHGQTMAGNKDQPSVSLTIAMKK